jgi:hypothetical protein
MAKSRARVSPPTPVEQEPGDRSSAVESTLADEALISAASTARADGEDDGQFVAELLKRAASKNRAALDKLAR